MDTQTLTRITCFKGIEKSQFLPTIMTTNVRSLGPKISNFIQEFDMRNVDLALLSETWGKDQNKLYKRKITELLELNGLQTESLNGTTKRGGGVALITSSKTTVLLRSSVRVSVQNFTSNLLCLYLLE